MTIFKKSISKFLAITVALSGIMASPINAAKTNESKSEKSRFRTIAFTTVGLTAIAITSAILYNKYVGSHSDSRSEEAFNSEINFLRALNSFPTEKANRNAKYIKLSPPTFFMTLSCRRRLSPQNLLTTLNPTVYIELSHADEFAERVRRDLSAIYMNLNNLSTEQLIVYDTGTLFEIYDEMARNEIWRANKTAEIYMELCNFYMILKRGILELRNSRNHLREVTITSIDMERRSRF